MGRYSLNQRPVHTGDVLEVETSMSAVEERVKADLVRHGPPAFFNVKFWQALGVRRLHLLSGDPRLRGLASQRENGFVLIRLNHSTRWMQDGELYRRNTQEDLSPTGVLAHELGHHFQWAMEEIGRLDPEVPAIFANWNRLKLDRFWCEYGKTSQTECFAEAFRLNLTNPELLGQIDDERAYMLTRLMQIFARHYEKIHGKKL